ncbi:MAG TPA: lipocalin-like domain-containing protein [Steroidobacteraceae bacterium]|nr:lipocalin-like domain-containing protein [Steroidobacteraceae bacterium]
MSAAKYILGTLVALETLVALPSALSLCSIATAAATDTTATKTGTAVATAGGAMDAAATKTEVAAAGGAMDATATNTGVAAAGEAAAAQPGYAAVTPDRTMVFPADFGSHPDFRTEWWYVTGWLTTHGEDLGFQVTFFRTKPKVDVTNPSSFAPRQLLIAHCAISDPKRGRLWQDQKIRRAGFGLADARVGDTGVWIDHWSLERDAGNYTAKIDAENFSLALTFVNTQAPLLNGNSGVSRKGPAVQAASYYYSLPHLKVAGSIVRDGRTTPVSGEAWFDHEWSSEYLDSQAVGWDWIGINLDDGAALMAFRMRGAHGESRWAGGTLRSADGTVQLLGPGDVTFASQRTWRSPRTGIVYPIQWQVHAGSREFELEPLLADQENDTRLSTGAIYWEGAVRAYEQHRVVGRGYLELTGYGERLRLR